MKRKVETILLPQNEQEFDLLIQKLIKKYEFTNPDQVAAVVATRIQHLPVDQATVTIEYLGHCVMKSMAYYVAQNKVSHIQHKLQVETIVTSIKLNPNDNQARDHLEGLARNGSKEAKEALDKLFPEVNSQKIISLHGEDTANVTAVSPEKPAG